MPSITQISKIFNKFKKTGSVLDQPRSGRPKKINEEVIEAIDQIIAETPKMSLTDMSPIVGVSRSTLVRYLKTTIGVKSYILQTHQELYEKDYDRRVQMADEILPILQNPTLGKLIFFSDEAIFHLSGYVHKNSYRIWDYEKPKETLEYERNSQKINVWCAMSSDCIIGPYFFDEETVTSKNYLKMLKEYFHPILFRKRIVNSVIFQQDGAPPYFGVDVRAWFNEKFPGRWIGRRGPIEWTARTPDLTPLDFFLWGYVKQLVYKETIKDLNRLREKITEAV